MDEAIEILCAKHFHQSMWLPENNVHSKLRITYATTGNFDDESLPVILFCTPMFGGRWCAVEADHLASSIGVRIICPDRYGAPNVNMITGIDGMKAWHGRLNPSELQYSSKRLVRDGPGIAEEAQGSICELTLSQRGHNLRAEYLVPSTGYLGSHITLRCHHGSLGLSRTFPRDAHESGSESSGWNAGLVGQGE